MGCGPYSLLYRVGNHKRRVANPAGTARQTALAGDAINRFQGIRRLLHVAWRFAYQDYRFGPQIV